MRGRLSFVVPAALLCLWGSTADAQIYAKKQADGTLVLSDRPLGPGTQTYAVPGSNTIRTTVPMVAGKASRYDDLIEQHAAAHNLRPELVRAVIHVESAFNPRARSNKGAMGLMQLMEGTASDLGVQNAYDPAQNIAGGVAYLRKLLDRFGGDEELALAAYNAGPGAVEKYGSAVPPYRETRDYIQKVKARTEVSAAPKNVIYKIIEIVDGRPVPRYSNVKPTGGQQYEVVKRPTLTASALP